MWVGWTVGKQSALVRRHFSHLFKLILEKAVIRSGGTTSGVAARTDNEFRPPR